MSAQEQLEMLLSARAFDSTGTKIGEVRQVYLDDSTGRATFATVSTGIFSADAIVPLFGARLLHGELHLDHTRSSIKSSPRFDHTEDALTPEQELDLLEHFGIEAAPLDGADSRDDADTASVPGATQGTDDTEQAEPGTIPARRLASVEEPRDTPEPEVGEDTGKAKSKEKNKDTDKNKDKADKAATAATGASTAAAATTGAAATTAKQGAKQGDKQTGKAEAADKPAAQAKEKDKPATQATDKAKAADNPAVRARDKATAKAADKPAAAAKTARKTVATKGDTADAADKPAAPATGSLASKLAATAKQAGRDDDSARPSSIEKAAETTTGTDATKDTSAPSDEK